MVWLLTYIVSHNNFDIEFCYHLTAHFLPGSKSSHLWNMSTPNNPSSLNKLLLNWVCILYEKQFFDTCTKLEVPEKQFVLKIKGCEHLARLTIYLITWKKKEKEDAFVSQETSSICLECIHVNNNEKETTAFRSLLFRLFCTTGSRDYLP